MTKNYDYDDDNDRPVRAQLVRPLGKIPPGMYSISSIFLIVIALVIGGWVAYKWCMIEVEDKEMAILIKKTGMDLPNDLELAPSAEYKGVQKDLLLEGRYFYNPYNWDWIVEPQIQIPADKAGIRTRMHGDDLPPGEMIAWEENQKGIVPGYLRPGSRHQINAYMIDGPNSRKKRPMGSYAEMIELVDPIDVPSGFKGIVTKLSAPMPTETNQLLSNLDESGEVRRGIQNETYGPGKYFVNPYITAVNLVDCRSQKFALSEVDGLLGFPTKDGFWVALDSKIEYYVKEADAARVFVTYNDISNDTPDGQRPIDEEIISKIILPNARSFARLKGSSHSGREFISSATRDEFQKEFEAALKETCGQQGIEIEKAMITDIRPPQQIAQPVRARQIALQEEAKYQKEILQQESEKDLAVEMAMVTQKQAIVAADQSVVGVVTEALKEQAVALIDASKRLAVSQQKLDASKDEAAATLALGKAEADVVHFQNEAEAAGWAKAVDAFGGNGNEFARWTLLKKLAPAYQRMMVNTHDSPVMDIFSSYDDPATGDAATRKPQAEEIDTDTQVKEFLEKIEKIESAVPAELIPEIPVVEASTTSGKSAIETTVESKAEASNDPASE